MTPLLSAKAVRAADRATIEDWHVPSRVLMETAGREAARVILDEYSRLGHATVLVGTGNNGGDGLVVARVLATRGIAVRVVLAPGDGSPDHVANLALLRGHAEAGEPVEITEADALSSRTDLVVDALLGHGATGDLRGAIRPLCDWMTGQSAPIVALDLPSGLDATTGRAAEGTPSADLTVAFAAISTGLVTGEGPVKSGRVVRVEIGIPDSEIRDRSTAWRASEAWAGAHLPRRAANAHKYSAGRALAIVGSRDFTGAAVLASTAAYRAGAGAVIACVPESAAETVDQHNVEVMVARQPETDDGTLSLDALDALLDQAASADAVIVGCGLGRSDETDALVRDLVARIEAPLVLDADGLGAFAGYTDLFRQRDTPLVLTPHLGEFRRLLDDDTYDPENRIEAVRELATRWGATVVFKGMPSIVGVPDGRVIIGPPGEPALATAGTGDTLAGCIGGLLAQGLAPADAAVCALHLGSVAARLWRVSHGDAGLIASDLVHLVPAAARTLRS